MKTEYKSRHLSSSEMTRLVKNNLANGERDHAEHHLSECSLCSEAYEGLTQLPDLSSLQTLNAKWKLKSGIKPVSKKLVINLHALYTLLIFIGLIAIVVIYFFFFNSNMKKSLEQNVLPIILSKSLSVEHFIIEEKSGAIDTALSEKKKITAPQLTEGSYDEIKKPGEPLVTLESIRVTKEIPVNRLVIIKGNSKQKLLNIEGLKIIDYSEVYSQDENMLQSFSEGLSARYETENKLQEEKIAEQMNTSIVSYEEVMAGGLRNFKKGKFANAVNDFDFILNYFPGDLNAKFYKALCFKEGGHYDQAVNNLKPLAQNNSHTFYEESKWHLSLCYDLIGDKSKSHQLCNEIIDEGGFYKEQA